MQRYDQAQQRGGPGGNRHSDQGRREHRLSARRLNLHVDFQVKNAGPWGTYGGIVFTDTLPDSLTYVSASVSPLSALAALACSAQGQTVTCPLNELQNGGTSGQATITLTVVASAAPQQIVNTAWALTVLPQTDSNATNNSATVSVTSK